MAAYPAKTLSLDPNPEGCAAFAINGTALIGMEREDGNFLLYFYGADENGRDLLIIERGELIVSMEAWDYEVKGRRFVVRRRSLSGLSRKIVLDLTKLDSGFKVTTGLLLHQGRGLRIKRNRIIVLSQNNTIRGIGFKDCYAGICVGIPKGGFMGID